MFTPNDVHVGCRAQILDPLIWKNGIYTAGYAFYVIGETDRGWLLQDSQGNNIPDFIGRLERIW